MKMNRAMSVQSGAKIDRTGERSASEARATEASPDDEIVRLGVPEADLTPNVRAACTALIEEARALRDALAEARGRISELEGLADRDPLLDTLNRRAFARELDRALAMIDRYGSRVSLLFIDLNDLKTINDEKGHAAGDAALVHVAEILAANVRQADVVARLGGDEFAVLLLQADASIAAAKGREVASLVAARPVAWDGAAFKVAVSWGAAEIDQGVSAQDAMSLADKAMYAAKKSK